MRPRRVRRALAAAFEKQDFPLDADLLPSTPVRQPIKTEQIRVFVAKREHGVKSTMPRRRTASRLRCKGVANLCSVDRESNRTG